MKDQRRAQVKAAYVMAGDLHKLQYTLTPADKQVILNKVMIPKVEKMKEVKMRAVESIQRFAENLFGQKVMNMYRTTPEMFKKMPVFAYNTHALYGNLKLEIDIDVPMYISPAKLIEEIKKSDAAPRIDKEIESYYMVAKDLVSKQEFAKNVLAKTTTLLNLIETQPIKYYDAFIQFRQPGLAPQPGRKRRNSS